MATRIGSGAAPSEQAAPCLVHFPPQPSGPLRGIGSKIASASPSGAWPRRLGAMVHALHEPFAGQQFLHARARQERQDLSLLDKVQIWHCGTASSSALALLRPLLSM